VLHRIGAGNPPSGAAGGYGWFDLWATLLAPRVLARAGRSGVRRAEGAQSRLVEESVGGQRVATERPVLTGE
jgi:hypothetical protein